jgi:hypothetical protein
MMMHSRRTPEQNTAQNKREAEDDFGFHGSFQRDSLIVSPAFSL